MLVFSGSRLRVLAYHEVPDKIAFDRQLMFLKRKYTLITLENLKSYLLNGTPLPKRPILITFDDGDYSVYEKGFPLLKKHRLPAVLFIISELINSNTTFWCRWVERVYEQQNRSYSEARTEIKRLKKVPNTKRIEALAKLPHMNSRQLTTEELKEMEGFDINMGNHTHTHPMLDKCTAEEISREMNDVRSNFNHWGLQGYPFFAYPNGNFDLQSEEILISEGIKLGFLFDHKVNKKVINPMRISRIRVNADADLDEFKLKVSGVHSLLMGMKNKILKN